MKRSLLILAAGLLGMLSLSNARGDGFIVIEQPFLVRPGHFPFAPLEVTSHQVNVKIDGQVAITSIDQEFYNPNDQRLEGFYMFPVPKGAHIDKFSMEIGGKTVDAELLPADKARGIYEDIVRKMRDPALLEYAGRDLFKVRIFPIEPRSRKPIKISYTELLRSDGGTVTYLYPLSTEKFSARPIKNLSMKIELKSAEPLASIYSPSHKVGIKRDGPNRAVIGYESKDERLEIVRFSTEAEPLFRELVPADSDHRKRANGFIDDFKPIGGTAIADALQSALKVRPDKSDRPFVVIFLTDGLPTVGARNPDEIVANIKKASGVRIFSFGIGSDVNTQLLDQIAEGTRAFSQYVLANEDLELKVSSFYTRIKEPVLTNVRLEFGGGVRTSKLYPAQLQDLFKVDQLVVTGRYTGSGEVEAKLTGMDNGREQTFNYKIKFNDSSNDYVARLWATRRVGFLLDEIRIHGETNELRDEATDLARRFGIVTPYTAYLIVEDEDRRRVPMTERSMQSMSADSAARAEVSKAWGGFKEKKDGEDAVANARSQNAFKFADQSAASIYSGAAESLRGFAFAAPAARAESDRATQYTQPSKCGHGRPC